MTATACAYVAPGWLIVADLFASMLLGAIVYAALDPRNDWRARWWRVAGPAGLACWLLVLYATVRLGGG